MVNKKVWQHVAVTYTLFDSTIRFYIDGALNGVAHSIPPPNPMETSVLRIGNDTWTLGPYGFNRKMDDVRMYNRALSICDIDSLVNAPCQGLQCGDIVSSMIAGYEFSGNANDISGNGHNGTVHDAVLTTDRCNKPDSAYLFSGSSGTYIEVPNASALSLSKTDFTISYWVYEPDSSVRGGNVLIKRNGTGVANSYHTGTVYATNKMYFSIAGGSPVSVVLYSDSVINSNVWTHLAVTYSYNNRRMKMYINDILAKDTIGVPSPIATNANLDIGRDFINQTAQRFYGKIDDIRIYSREFDSCGIAALYNYACNVLPVSLISFTSVLRNNSVICTWQTATETNTSYFIIQRSTDGANFASLGKVYASGNSNTSKSYSFTDKSPNNGINYYRLQMVDKDGKYSYSKTLPVNISIKQPFTIYPNPVKDVLYVQVQRSMAEQVSLHVIDMQGKTISQQSRQLATGITTLSVNTTGLAKGSYFVVIKGQTTEKKLFIKE